jgi:hypothetical protein
MRAPRRSSFVRRAAGVFLAPYAVVGALLVLVFGLAALAIVVQLLAALLRHA